MGRLGMGASSSLSLSSDPINRAILSSIDKELVDCRVLAFFGGGRDVSAVERLLERILRSHSGSFDVSSSVCWLDWLSCNHVSDAQRSDSVLPVPVGLSINAMFLFSMAEWMASMTCS